MKYTLLDLINKTLSAIDSQSVVTASGSPESEQVGLIVNRLYNEICSMRDWPWLRVVGTNLVSAGTNAWQLDLPDNLLTLEYLTYKGKELKYLTPEEMHQIFMGRTASTTITNSEGVYIDRDPVYWTSYDDETLTFDAYDETYTNLLPSLTYVQYIKDIPSELSGDTDYPIIHPRYHSVLLQGILATAFNELAQDTAKYDRANDKYVKGIAKMQVWARKIEQTLPTFKVAGNYGRNGR